MNKSKEDHIIIVQITVAPIGTGTASLSKWVAEVEKVTSKYENIKSMLTPMSTILEGPFQDVMNCVMEMHQAPFKNGAIRVSTRIAIDERRDKVASMDSKLESVKAKM